MNLHFKIFEALAGKHDDLSVCVTTTSTTQCYNRIIFGDKIFDSSEIFVISIKFKQSIYFGNCTARQTTI